MAHTPAAVPSAAVPLSAAEIAAAAAARGLAIPSHCEEGVAANLALLARHARTMRQTPTETQA
jgi:sodium/bile acid cotransporter 7